MTKKVIDKSNSIIVIRFRYRQVTPTRNSNDVAVIFECITHDYSKSFANLIYTCELSLHNRHSLKSGNVLSNVPFKVFPIEQVFSTLY